MIKTKKWFVSLAIIISFVSITGVSANAKSVNHHYHVVSSNAFKQGVFSAGYVTGTAGAKIYQQTDYNQYSFALKIGTKVTVNPSTKDFYQIKYKGKQGYVSHYLVSPFNTYHFANGYASNLNPNDKKHIVLKKGTKQSYKVFWQFKSEKNIKIWHYVKGHWVID
ncbi:hypothetical protein [Lentilactobacillus kisonensis]|nr:hypothetical protein [Lentilactobacillus kisonensis]